MPVAAVQTYVRINEVPHMEMPALPCKCAGGLCCAVAAGTKSRAGVCYPVQFYHVWLCEIPGTQVLQYLRLLWLCSDVFTYHTCLPVCWGADVAGMY